MLVPRLLRENREFRRFWAGQTVSLVGDQISSIALPLVAVLALDASAAQMGYLVSAALVRTSSSRCTPAPGSTGAGGGDR